MGYVALIGYDGERRYMTPSADKDYHQFAYCFCRKDYLDRYSIDVNFMGWSKNFSYEELTGHEVYDYSHSLEFDKELKRRLMEAQAMVQAEGRDKFLHDSDTAIIIDCPRIALNTFASLERVLASNLRIHLGEEASEEFLKRTLYKQAK